MPHYLKRVRNPRSRRNAPIQIGGQTLSVQEVKELLDMGLITKEQVQAAMSGGEPARPARPAKPPRRRAQQPEPSSFVGGLSPLDFGDKPKKPRKTEAERAAWKPSRAEWDTPVAYPVAAKIVRSMGGFRVCFPRYCSQKIAGASGKPRNVTVADILQSFGITQGKAWEIIKSFEEAGVLHQKGASSTDRRARIPAARAIFTEMTKSQKAPSGIPIPLP